MQPPPPPAAGLRVPSGRRLFHIRRHLMRKVPGKHPGYARHARPKGKRQSNQQTRMYVKRQIRENREVEAT